MKDLTVRQVMTPCVEVLRPDTKLSEARTQFLDGIYHHLPVVTPDGVLLGLISSNDLLRLSFDAYGINAKTVDLVIDSQFNLEQIMCKEIVTVGPDDTISSAAAFLSDGSFHSLPVVDDERRLLGIITSTDLITFLLDQLQCGISGL